MAHNRKISEKYSLDYYRHSLPTRSWKSRGNYLALLLALSTFAAMYAVGRNSTFQAAPVASVHSSFGTDCAACHDRSWGAGRRLKTVSSLPHSISNDSCQKCHLVSPHAAITLVEPACVACHQEHRPEKRLVDLVDTACTQCHQNLQEATSKPVSFVASVDRFEAGADGHPEFALLRRESDSVGRNAANRVAHFDVAKKEWRDRGGLKFNHQLHLDGQRVLGPDRKPVQLYCANCHIRGADGYMQPIVYEQHCRKCHTTRLGEPFAALGELPHTTVEEVRGVIRERLAQQLQSKPKNATEPQPSTFPKLPRAARLSSEQEQTLTEKMKGVDATLFTVHTQLDRAEHAILSPEAKGACSHCHHLVVQDGQWQVLNTNPDLQPERLLKSQIKPDGMIPARWMYHAKFDHKSHRTVDCEQCHAARTSAHTSDILLPSITVCRNCHGSDAPTAKPHIRADCVLCHDYHMDNAAHEPPGIPLNRLFPNALESPDTLTQ